MGRGRPVIWVNHLLVSHIGLDSRIALFHDCFEAIASKFTLVRFDHRGTGLSDRNVDDLSLEARVRDLDAVCRRLDAPAVGIISVLTGAFPTLAYAADNPKQVSRVVLIGGAVTGEEVLALPQREVLLGALERDWEMYTEMAASLVVGWSGPEARSLAALMDNGIKPEMARAVTAAFGGYDLSTVLRRVQVPTLVLHHTGVKLTNLDSSRALAAQIPNARLEVFEGAYADSLDKTIEQFMKFLLDSDVAPPPDRPESPVESTFRTILFTDLENHTSMMRQLGDVKGREVLRELEKITRDALGLHGGTEVKTMGDGFMASFRSAQSGLECALAIQQAFEDRNRQAAVPLRVRVGVNAGEPIVEESDLFGSAVILAARVASEAHGGQILVSNVVRELAEGKAFVFTDAGEFRLRGFDDPVRLFELRAR
jgi:class 3 adenylate cyclase/pimeloyl-ACP methyl ester carboxylesterase